MPSRNQREECFPATPSAASVCVSFIVSMIYEMQRQGTRIGGTSLCVGGGPAMASLWSLDV